MAAGNTEVVRVFISYRREDSIGIAGRIRDRLATAFGATHVFFDIDAIPLGVDFRQYIRRMVADCDVLLVIIGRRWVDVVNDNGRRRLEVPTDFVRLEVEAALQREIPVVPVLVDGAAIPNADKLPESLAELAFRNGTQVRYDPDFHADVDRLIRHLTSVSRGNEERETLESWPPTTTSPGDAQRTEPVSSQHVEQSVKGRTYRRADAKAQTTRPQANRHRLVAELKKLGYSLGSAYLSETSKNIYYADRGFHKKPRIVLRDGRIRIEKVASSDLTSTTWKLWKSFSLEYELDSALETIRSMKGRPSKKR